MEMTRVKSCEVAECAYNSKKMCHALAITIGDLDNPMCDTFCQSATPRAATKKMSPASAPARSGPVHTTSPLNVIAKALMWATKKPRSTACRSQLLSETAAQQNIGPAGKNPFPRVVA
jgi:hypothetical protein